MNKQQRERQAIRWEAQFEQLTEEEQQEWRETGSVDDPTNTP